MTLRASDELVVQLGVRFEGGDLGVRLALDELRGHRADAGADLEDAVAEVGDELVGDPAEEVIGFGEALQLDVGAERRSGGGLLVEQAIRPAGPRGLVGAHLGADLLGVSAHRQGGCGRTRRHRRPTRCRCPSSAAGTRSVPRRSCSRRPGSGRRTSSRRRTPAAAARRRAASWRRRATSPRTRSSRRAPDAVPKPGARGVRPSGWPAPATAWPRVPSHRSPIVIRWSVHCAGRRTPERGR